MPQVTGFNDYQRVSEQAGTQLFALTGVTLVSLPSTGILDTTGYGYLDVTVTSPQTANAYILVEWFSDPAGANLINNTITTLPVSSFATKQYPVISRWVRIRIIQINGPNTDTISMHVWGASAFINRLGVEQAGFPFLYGSFALAAGTSGTALAQTVFEGAAFWSNSSSGNSNWFAQLDYFDSSSAVWNTFILLFGANQGQGSCISIGLPPAPVRSIIHNTDAAAHSLTTAIMLA